MHNSDIFLVNYEALHLDCVFWKTRVQGVLCFYFIFIVNNGSTSAS